MSTQQNLINDHYKIIAKAGADKSGYFLRLQDPDSGKKYYTKLIKIDDNHLSAKVLYALQMRVQRLTQFSHTNMISVCEPELAPEGLLIRQTDLEGFSLKALMQKNGRPLSLPEAYRIALDIASVLAALHSEGLVHGELDPSHIWIDTQGKNYLSFLELPPAFDSDRPVYRMPDLTPNAEPKIDSDIFAFGILLLEMCTGLSAYRSTGDETDVEDYSHLFAYYRECVTEHVGLEVPDLVPILSRCLSENKAQRYKNGEELYWAVRALIEKNLPKKEEVSDGKAPSGKSGKPEKPQKKAEKPASFDTGGSKKKPTVLPFLFFGVLLIGAGVYCWLKKPDILTKFTSPTESSPAYEQTLSVLHITQTSISHDQEIRAVEATATETPQPTETPTPVPTATQLPRPISAETGRAVRWIADDSVMAGVPASRFTMGMDSTFRFDMNGILPSHTVSLDAFWIDQTEVTQAQYARCVSEGVCQPIERIADEWIGDDLPIMNVRWTDALTYCTWVGKRLPTEAEWEKAARGEDRRLYPWGNFSIGVGMLPNRIQKVGSDERDVSPYGVMDMAGNVSEWVNDFYSETRLINDSELVNPIGPLSGNMHTVKGGSFLAADPESERFVFNRRGAMPDMVQNYGFRCVVSGTDIDTTKAVEVSDRLTLADPVKGVDQPAGCTNRAKFVNDVTIPDGTPVKRGEWITKTWTLENYGTCPWNENYKVVWNNDDIENQQQLFDIGVDLEPGEQGEISVSFPVQGSDLTHISFLLAGPDGQTFGLGPQMRGDLYVEYRVE